MPPKAAKKSKCVVCNKEFKPKRSTAMYCSDACRIKGVRAKAEPIDTILLTPTKRSVAVTKDKEEVEEPYDYQKNYDAFVKMGITPTTWITTGIPEFDALTQIPRGRITQIQGPFSSGKTTLALNMIKGLTKHKVLYIDSEAALHPQILTLLNIRANNFVLYNASAFIEDIYEVIIDAARSGEFDMIIFDSVAACTFHNEVEGSATDRQIGQKALVMNKLMRIVPMMLKDTDTALVIINQEREVIGSYAPVKYTPGGMGVNYAASLMIQLKSLKSWRFPEKPTDGIYKGQEVEVQIIKSKVNIPWRTAKFKLYYPQPKAEMQYTDPETGEILEPAF